MSPNTKDDTSGSYPYKAINAVIISWSEDDLDIDTELAGGPSLEWNSLQAPLEHAFIDILLILDCCNASATASFEQDLEDGPEPTNRFEILAGCGFDAVTRGAGRYSFTAALTAEMKTQCNRERIFSVAQLYQWLHAKMLRQHPSSIPDSEDEEFEKCFVAPLYIARFTDYNHVSIPLKKMDAPVLDKNGCLSDRFGESTNGWRGAGSWGANSPPSSLDESTSTSTDCTTPITGSVSQSSIDSSWNEKVYASEKEQNGDTKPAYSTEFGIWSTYDDKRTVQDLAKSLKCSRIEEKVVQRTVPIDW